LSTKSWAWGTVDVAGHGERRALAVQAVAVGVPVAVEARVVEVGRDVVAGEGLRVGETQRDHVGVAAEQHPLRRPARIAIADELAQPVGVVGAGRILRAHERHGAHDRGHTGACLPVGQALELRRHVVARDDHVLDRTAEQRRHLRRAEALCAAALRGGGARRLTERIGFADRDGRIRQARGGVQLARGLPLAHDALALERGSGIAHEVQAHAHAADELELSGRRVPAHRLGEDERDAVARFITLQSDARRHRGLEAGRRVARGIRRRTHDRPQPVRRHDGGRDARMEPERFGLEADDFDRCDSQALGQRHALLERRQVGQPGRRLGDAAVGRHFGRPGPVHDVNLVAREEEIALERRVGVRRGGERGGEDDADSPAQSSDHGWNSSG
jgi:hypothetical protein